MSSWTCPYCNQIATLLESNISRDKHTFSMGNKHGGMALTTTAIVCPNEKCREYTLSGSLQGAKFYHGGIVELIGQEIKRWQLRPESAAKPFPDYIPAVILSDYAEACLIRDLSPKASATLSRRCMQGIIRNYWSITNNNLAKAIIELEDKIDGTTWGAIDAIRKIGNIGAHMEKDIDLIVDVDPEEAGMLIDLIEMMLEEWYIHRHERGLKMQKIIDAADSKKEMKDAGKAAKQSATPSSATVSPPKA